MKLTFNITLKPLVPASRPRRITDSAGFTGEQQWLAPLHLSGGGSVAGSAPCWAGPPQSPVKSTDLSLPRRPSSRWSARNLQILSARLLLAHGFPGGQQCGISGRVMEGLKETEVKSGIMKQFIIDLITVKPHSNHLGANEGNPLNITREEREL